MRKVAVYLGVWALISPAVVHASARCVDQTTGASSYQAGGQQNKDREEVKTFNGKIARDGDLFVLQDSSGKTAYRLDDQNKASQFDGKKVKVTGTLDAANNLIHVQSIEEAA